MARKKPRRKEKGGTKSNDSEEDDKDQGETEKLSTPAKEPPNTRPKRKTRSSRSASKKAMAKLKEESSEDEMEQLRKEDSDIDNENESTGDDPAPTNDETEEEEYDASEKDGEDHKQPKKKKQKTGKGKHKCPHCDKPFTSEAGLKYHVANYVCRIDECKDPEVLAKANKKKRARGKSKHKATDTPKSYKRLRGKLEDRVCPHCNRVFTSTLGLKYHVSRKVCQQKAKSDAPKIILHNLEPGERFMTSFGAVEVISDDRGESTAPADKIPPAQMRSLNSAKSKVEKQRSKVIDSKYTRLRARKYRINELLGRGKSINKASVFYAYHGGDPSELNENKKLAPLPPKPVDPHTPPESSPDRIVECVWLQPDGSAPENPTSSQRLFLQRRMLTEHYVDSKNIHTCKDCGNKFTSGPGYKYHTQNRVCISKNEKRTAARRERHQLVAMGAARILKTKYCPPEYQVDDPQSDLGPRSEGATRKKKRKGKKKKALGMYPEVLISLGYKVIKENMKITDDMLFQNAEPSMVDTTVPQPTLSLTSDAPDTIMDDLKQKLLARQRVSDDQKYGSMYKEVYKALGYTRPRRRRETGSSLRRKRAKVVKPPPPIIDISALADEIDSGRYPSKKRYKGDDHTDHCVICKEAGTLLCCDFCKNAVHMHCMAEKFTIKAPEPDDDFMCHKCIGIIMSRRKRAEGRRLKKQEKDELDKTTIQKQNPDIKAGMEYEQLASKGQEYSELIELLQDARQRLRQSLATSKMNDIRRKLIRFD